MLVFVGLLTVSDREGRFLWKPKTLKLDILPFIDYDMDETLQLLARAGLVRSYEIAGLKYGDIPTFLKHQVINHREPDSVIPPFEIARESTGRARESTGACPGKYWACPGKYWACPGKYWACPGGREGKGRE